jgi:hypothetical protein
LRPSAPSTTRCSAGGTAPHRVRSRTSVAVSSEQRVVVAREVRGPGLPPGSEMAVGGRHELLLKLLELSTAGLLSGLVATICEEEVAHGLLRDRRTPSLATAEAGTNPGDPLDPGRQVRQERRPSRGHGMESRGLVRRPKASGDRGNRRWRGCRAWGFAAVAVLLGDFHFQGRCPTNTPKNQDTTRRASPRWRSHPASGRPWSVETRAPGRRFFFEAHQAVVGRWLSLVPRTRIVNLV